MKAGIAGAGLMGRLIAWQLSELGWSVTLFDKDIKGQQSAAFAAAGMLAPYAEHEAEPIIFRMGMQAVASWQTLAEKFDDSSWLQLQGSIVTAHSSDHYHLEELIARLQQKIPTPDFSLLNEKTVKDLEPGLQCKKAIYLNKEGAINSRLLLTLLEQQLTKAGAKWQDKVTVTSVKPHTISTTENAYQFDWVFDCRGTGANNNFSDLRAVRGEVIRLYAPDVKITRPVRLLHPRYRLYIVPRPQSVYVIGASEIESNDTSAISVRSCLELLSAAYSVHSGFAEARIIETLSALRPALLDNLPRIIYQQGMIAVNGLYRHGFLLAPVLLSEISNLLYNADNVSAYPDIIKWDL